VATVLGPAATIAPTPAAAALSQPRLLNLHTVDEDEWHADNDFKLRWSRPPWSGLELPVAAVHYEIADAGGTPVLPEVRLGEDANVIDHIRVPSQPGAYTIQVWLEGSSGGSGDPQSATLRFDDTRPGVAQPLAPTGWIGAASAPILHIEHPAGPLPSSGIRGYAVSIGPDAAGTPCAGPDRCSEAETDLRGGVGDDAISLAGLSEGTSYLRTYAVSGSGMRSATLGSATLHVDATRPEVELHGVPPGWANGPVSLSARAVDRLSGMAAAGPAGPYTAIAVDGRAPKSAGGDTVAAVVSGGGRHRIAAFARDAAGNVSGEGGSAAPSLAVVEIDEDPPHVAFGRSQDPTDPERIEATVADPLSGPDGLRGSIAVRPAGTRRQFTELPTAVSQGRLTARWDSDSFAAGDYEFRATGYDLAGNSGVDDRRSTGARMVLPNPLKRVTAIEAGFGARRLVWHRCVQVDGGRRCRREVIQSFARRPTLRAAPYGRSLPFAGRLTSKSGAPLGGLPVQVIETFGAGANPEQRTTTVQTAADGIFLARLSPGPGRQVEAVFAGNRVLTRAVAAQRPRLSVLTGVDMHASSARALVGGAPVVFSGRLRSSGASIPSEGMPVEFQYRLPGTEWTGFHTVKTDAQGRFRYAYAFSDDDSRGARFEFRAYVPAQEGWPYEPAGSRPLFVTGR
jgi:5-hydroxyisourate hydrolase-like protein (transthyretin family)